MQRYFGVSPPTVHQMILTLQARGFIERVSRTPRSVLLMVPRSDLPDLE
jgi:DNA-binding IclR family transcriptional regulator